MEERNRQGHITEEGKCKWKENIQKKERKREIN